ncbi:MAG: hypothetical protein ABL998_12205 [Planctomycetota bacterium]
MSPAATAGARRWVWLLVVPLCALYGWNLWRTWFQSDDAFISFRYARHLADGLGLVWNPLERVEGYTNFSWVVLMAGGMKLGLAPEVFSNVLGAACGAGLIGTLLCFGARGRGFASPWPWLAAFALAAHPSFVAWCTGGLETMLFALCVFAGFAALLSPPQAAKAALPVSAAAFALGALTRPAGLMFGALAGLVLALDVVLRRRTWRAAAAWGVLAGVPVAAHLLWRHAYYGEWVPNTFHAKVGGLWLEQGWRYLAYFHGCYKVGWFAPLALVALLGRRRREAATLLAVVLVHASYVVAVGGDLFELRFFVHVMPFLAWLFVEGLAVLARGRAGVSVAALGGCALLWTNATGLERVEAKRYHLQSIEGIREYTRARIEEGRTLRAAIEDGRLPRELVFGVGGAGAVPYYTDWETVDRRGLNDAYIAHLPLVEHGFIGHERDAPYEYLVERKVVAFDHFNQTLIKRAGLRQLRGPFEHDGRRVTLHAIPLDERAFVFTTFVSPAELAAAFPGQRVLTLGGD